VGGLAIAAGMAVPALELGVWEGGEVGFGILEG